ncbi:uncharacterized protein [Littorina saxatilis]|uniref:uncharacterized protein n=1 Tax=Littorina saxatilis TaxID=31220 RepID=UPI0038B4BFA6
MGSNISLMITNDMYGDSSDMPVNVSRSETTLQPRGECLGSGLVESDNDVSPSCGNIDQRKRMPLPHEAVDIDKDSVACESASTCTVPVHIAQRGRMPLPPEAFQDDSAKGAVGGALSCNEEGDYADINDVLEEIEEEALQGTGVASEDEDVYTDIDDMRSKANVLREKRIHKRE